MPLIINNIQDIENAKIKILEEVTIEAKRYITSISKLKEFDYIFLKSFGYFEELIDRILLIVYTSNGKKLESLGIHLKIEICRDIVNSTDFYESLKKAEKLISYRNKVAHKLDYKLEEDDNFLKLIKFKKSNSLLNDHLNKKSLLIKYFNEVYGSPLTIVIGSKLNKKFFEWAQD